MITLPPYNRFEILLSRSKPTPQKKGMVSKCLWGWVELRLLTFDFTQVAQALFIYDLNCKLIFVIISHGEFLLL